MQVVVLINIIMDRSRGSVRIEEDERGPGGKILAPKHFDNNFVQTKTTLNVYK